MPPPSNNGTLHASAASTLIVTGGLTNLSGNTPTGGTYDVEGTLRIAGANILTDSAHIILDGPASQFLNDTTSTDALAALSSVTATGELDVVNGRAFTTTASFSNAGTVDVGAGSSFTNAGDYTQTGGLTNVNGTLDPAGNFNLQAGVLEGNGAVLASLIQTGGAVQPGNSIGTLGVTGNYIMSAAATLNMELGDHTWDQLLVGGNVQLDGTLNLLFLPGFAASNGDILTLLQYGSHSGAFAAINGLTFGQYSFAPIYNATDFELQVGVTASSTPESATWMTLAGAALLLAAMRAKRKRT